MYANFLDNRIYHEIEAPAKVRSSVLEYIDSFNTTNKRKIDIVLFDDAISMLC